MRVARGDHRPIAAGLDRGRCHREDRVALPEHVVGAGRSGGHRLIKAPDACRPCGVHDRGDIRVATMTDRRKRRPGKQTGRCQAEWRDTEAGPNGTATFAEQPQRPVGLPGDNAPIRRRRDRQLDRGPPGVTAHTRRHSECRRVQHPQPATRVRAPGPERAVGLRGKGRLSTGKHILPVRLEIDPDRRLPVVGAVVSELIGEPGTPAPQ